MDDNEMFAALGICAVIIVIMLSMTNCSIEQTKSNDKARVEIIKAEKGCK